MKTKSVEKFCILAFFAIFCGAHSSPTLIDDDTVVVGDLSPSVEENGLQFLNRQRRDTYATINGEQVETSCVTVRNVPGTCQTFQDCYPIFNLRETKSGRNLDDLRSNVNRAEEELRGIYRSISGPCSNTVLSSISKALGKPVSGANYVCCPRERNYTKVTELSRPPAPVDSPAYQNQPCGRYFVEKSIENITRGDEDASTRIVNGRPANRGEFPWIVALFLRSQFCAGSLLDSTHVLTAAHCVYFMNRNDVNRLRLQIGDHNIYSTQDGPHQVRTATNVYYHRHFSMSNLYHDVAVIRLASPVTFNNYVQPICLSTNTWGYEKSYANVAGWGQVSEKGSQSSILRTVSVEVWNQNRCSRTYQGKAPAGITNGMLCAGGRGYDSCKGDSGGPMSVTRNSRAEQIGIVSWGIGCGTFPGVYTRVDQYLAWINKNRR